MTRPESFCDSVPDPIEHRPGIRRHGAGRAGPGNVIPRPGDLFGLLQNPRLGPGNNHISVLQQNTHCGGPHLGNGIRRDIGGDRLVVVVVDQEFLPGGGHIQPLQAGGRAAARD